MIYLPSIPPFLAAGIILILGIRCLAMGGKKITTVLFSLSCLAIIAASSGLGSLILSTSPFGTLVSFRVILCGSFAAAGFIAPFFLIWGKKPLSRTDVLVAAAITFFGTALAAAAALIPLNLIVRSVQFLEEEPGIFWGASLSIWAKAASGILLLANVFVLHRLENLFRSADIPGKVTLKYPLLGLVIASIINFSFFSHVLAVSYVSRNYLSILSLGMVIPGVTFLYSCVRYRPFDIRFPNKSGTSTYSMLLAGIYLLALGLISYISSVSGMSYDSFTLLLLLVFAVFLLCAIAISGKVRRRIRAFISENFHPDRYNYRREWRHYSRIMSSGSDMESLLQNTISSICESMLVGRGCIWIDSPVETAAFYGAQPGGEEFEYIKGIAGIPKPDGRVAFSSDSGPKPWLASAAEIPSGAGAGAPGWIKAASFLGSGEENLGVVALGVKDTRAKYSEEDRTFLSIISEQLSTAIENLIMEEKIMESDRIESFNRFASFVIHDLKNTMGMLSLTAENAKTNMGDPRFQKDAAETMQRAAAKINSLIASLSAHKSPPSLSKRDIDIAEFLDLRRGEMEKLLSPKGISLEIESGKGLVARADSTAIVRILENLLINSMEASRKGSGISIHAERSAEGYIDITVSDRGMGFEPAYLRHHLFKPFNSTKKNGLGIGLVICKSLAEAHDGSIIVESEPGEGAAITLRLPAAGGN